MTQRAKSASGGVISRYNDRRQDESMWIVLSDEDPADVEHALLATYAARGAIELGHANEIGAKLVRPARFEWRRD